MDEGLLLHLMQSVWIAVSKNSDLKWLSIFKFIHKKTGIQKIPVFMISIKKRDEIIFFFSSSLAILFALVLVPLILAFSLPTCFVFWVWLYSVEFLHEFSCHQSILS